jgi:hypothetical protein
MSLVRRVDEIPTLREMPKTIPAQTYNRIRVGLIRFRLPLRLPLGEQPGLECILDEAVWLCVDSRHDDLPMLAWCHFQTQGRGLTSPVPCRLRLFHIQSGLVMGRALDALTMAVTDHMDAHWPVRPHADVVSLGELRPKPPRV